MQLLLKGDRIRLEVRTLGGWKGTATVTQDQRSVDDVVWFRKDGADPDDWLEDSCCACRHEVSRLVDDVVWFRKDGADPDDWLKIAVAPAVMKFLGWLTMSCGLEKTGRTRMTG